MTVPDGLIAVMRRPLEMARPSMLVIAFTAVAAPYACAEAGETKHSAHAITAAASTDLIASGVMSARMARDAAERPGGRARRATGGSGGRRECAGRCADEGTKAGA